MTMCADGLAKLAEECGELVQVVAKKMAYFDTDEHPDGSNLRVRLQEEMADVLGAILFVLEARNLDDGAVWQRAHDKLQRFRGWHVQTDNDAGFAAALKTGDAP